MRQFLRCPSCNEVIPFGERLCKYCSAEISHEAAQEAAEQFAKLSDACSLANNLNIMNPLAPLMLGGYVVITLLSWAHPAHNPIVYGLPLAPLITVFYWHLTYGKLQSNDEEFQRARKDVRKSLLIWIPTTILLLAFLVFWAVR